MSGSGARHRQRPYPRAGARALLIALAAWSPWAQGWGNPADFLDAAPEQAGEVGGPPPATQPPATPNALAGNPSPYLALHGQDPVAWRPWGPEVLREARAQGRPLFISSGYFACHWCHVMQRESFRDPGIAGLLNAHFIPVKLDRELHPALDSYLIDFTQRTAGRAGWPLNVVLTPEGYPLAGFTYEPQARVADILGRMARLWETRAGELTELARRDLEAASGAKAGKEVEGPALAPDAVAARLKAEALARADLVGGGFGHQARFPMAPHLGVLLDLQARAPDPELAGFLRLTLDQMVRWGLRDHLGGGFFRYTVDPDWATPHFEKMLYDQALLIPVLLKAADVLGEPRYRLVAREALDFVLGTLCRPDGACIGSLSAVDAAGEEGGYYLWRREDLDRLLSLGVRRLAGRTWGLEGPPAHAAGSLPVAARDPGAVAAELGLDPGASGALLDQARASLLAERATRVLPADTKALAAWNGLTLSALVVGARAFPGGPYRQAAGALRDYLVRVLWDGTELHRGRSDQGWIGEATLEDYAFVAQGLGDWAGLADSTEDRALARRLAGLAWARFYGEGGWRLAADSLLPGVPAEPALADGALPSPAAVLLAFSLDTGEADLVAQARAAQGAAAALVAGRPFAFAGQAWTLIRWPLADPGT